ncbi:MAG: hypothetical protein HY901_05210, partial [Deltaproteobacteria bacterium]|nr:hypothetical protein [Deltaproteobacteria bacterium]
MAVEASRKLQLPSGQVGVVNDLERASWFVHVVGNRERERPQGHDYWVGQFDSQGPPPIGESLVGVQPVDGLPTRAIMLKNVYRSMEPDGM